jgi:hypothetical protein
MFPVADKENMKMFTMDNTNEITNETIRSVVDDLADQFMDGFCYTNAELIVDECKRRGVTVDFYAGWMFTDINNLLPVHHSWVVYEDNLIDVSIRRSLYDLFKTINYQPTTLTSHQTLLPQQAHKQYALPKYEPPGSAVFRPTEP